MSTQSSSFELLHPLIQQWIWQAGWTELRDAQEKSIPPIIAGNTDVIISAATAAGKTEAAFLPILSRLLGPDAAGHSALCISPLKALINDQWDRLTQLCETLEIPIVPWHGDVAASRKQVFAKKRSGCVLITPESLEALFYNRGSGIVGLFERLDYVVVDELHAFMGSERGMQLQSLLDRLEVALGRHVPRIGLSATLGDIQLAAAFLRPGEGAKVTIIESAQSSSSLRILIKGYQDGPPQLSDEDVEERVKRGQPVSAMETTSSGMLQIGRHVYDNLRGRNHLIFPNSRQKVEQYTALLRAMCERDCVPAEFWPHHGNLSKELREETERALKQTVTPASAVATSTLELGVDIGPVESVVQIGPAPSVSSLRQRLGRSGRRKGTPAILRGYALEAPLDARSTVPDRLREDMVQLIAQVDLLLQRWVEPPRVGGMHLSTLIQQLLSLIGQRGGVMAADAFRQLCVRGPFRSVTQADFVTVLRALGAKEILIQDSSGLLLHGPAGEAITGHYSFYAAFSSPEEFRLVSRGRTLGSLPMTSPLAEGDFLLFAGRRWKVVRIDDGQKVIEVEPAAGGRAPSFGGSPGMVHTRVRQQMRQILATETPVPFLDEEAQRLLNGARATYQSFGLDKACHADDGGTLRLFLWQGDEIQTTLALMLKFFGMEAANEGLCLGLGGASIKEVERLMTRLVEGEPMHAADLLRHVENLAVEKWDSLLPPPLLQVNYASQFLDLPGTYAFLRHHLDASDSH
ncbi:MULTISPECIES: DEAD/DEAH box helicase [Pandoraea]|uniref:DEAD/DEAH box helicase n=2 Tax=Pandoraea TaxID=93217 RepID=A0A5E4XI39_9BURK|nr:MULTISPECIES: DEAD/DEAH box helicase [Pandoraea]VVE18092.1 DEAD/DEAH box helicase [Pandoraea cepalis]VVE35956.1 DEAD/DEAH box helicase [Pandoraea terrigena]